MTALLWSLLGIMAGASIALQAPINAQLGKELGLPVAAAAASFLSGAVLLVAVTAALAYAQGLSLNWRGPALWMFVVGGALGAAYVTTAILLIPRLGAAATMAFIVAGQLVGGMLIDRIGMFGAAVREISVGRVAGAVMLLFGAVLIRIY